MGVAHIGDVGDQLVGEFVVGQEPSALAQPPRAEMRLIDRHRLSPRLALAALGHVFGVGPGEVGAVSDDRSGRGPELPLEAKRVRFERQQSAVRIQELELINRSDCQFRDEDLPQAAVEAPAHLAAPAIPPIEVADDGNAGRVRRPEGEQHAVDALVADELGAKPSVELAMRALPHQIVVERTQRRAERVGVHIGMGPMRGCDLDSISGPLLERRDERLENVILAPRQLGDELAIAGYRANRDCVRSKDTDHPSGRRQMRPEHRERIGIARSRNRVELLVARFPALPHSVLHKSLSLSARKAHSRYPLRIRKLFDRRRTSRHWPCSERSNAANGSDRATLRRSSPVSASKRRSRRRS